MEFVARLKDEADKFSARMRRKAEIAQEADSELNIAQAAVAMDSVEGDMQTNNYMVGWNAEVKRLEELAATGSITAAQEQRLRHVRRNIATIRDAEAVRHPTPENMAGRRLAELGPVGRVQGLLGGVGGFLAGRVWLAVALGWGLTGGAVAVQSMRLHNAKDHIGRLEADNAALEQSRTAYAHALAQERDQHAHDVASVLNETATTVRQLEQRAARERAAAARERARHEDLATGNINFGERLRELATPDSHGGVSPAPAAPAGGDPASGLPASIGPDPNARPAR